MHETMQTESSIQLSLESSGMTITLDGKTYEHMGPLYGYQDVVSGVKFRSNTQTDLAVYYNTVEQSSLRLIGGGYAAVDTIWFDGQQRAPEYWVQLIAPFWKESIRVSTEKEREQRELYRTFKMLAGLYVKKIYLEKRLKHPTRSKRVKDAEYMISFLEKKLASLGYTRDGFEAMHSRAANDYGMIDGELYENLASLFKLDA